MNVFLTIVIMQPQGLLQRSRIRAGTFAMLSVLLLTFPSWAAEYLSVEDALSRLSKGQSVPGQRAGYVSAEDALSQANQQIQQRPALHSAPIVQNNVATLPSSQAPVSATATRFTKDDIWPEASYYVGNPSYSFPAEGVFPGNGWSGNLVVGWPYPVYAVPTMYGYYPGDPRFVGYGNPPGMAVNPQVVADWLFGRPVAQQINMETAVDPAPNPTPTEKLTLAAVVAPRLKPQATPTPVPTPSMSVVQSVATQPDSTQATAERAAYEQVIYAQKLALLALETRLARQDALRWMGGTILFGLITGGFCLYTLRRNTQKED